MAKIYAKKRSGAKSGGKGKGRYARKKTSSRVFKRSGTSSKTKLDAMVAREVQKVLNSGALNERRRVTMGLSISETQVYINGKAAFNNCIRIPISAAILAMADAASSPDVRRRGTNNATEDGMASAVERVNEAFASFLKIPRIVGDRAQRIQCYMKKELSLHLKELSNRPLKEQLGGLDLGQETVEDRNGCPWGSSGCDAGRKCFGCDVSEDAVPVDMPLESDSDD